MDVASIFKRKKPVLSFEVFPPKTEAPLEDIAPIIAELAEFSPDFISVTFGAAGSKQSNKTIAIAEMIKKEYGIEAVVHLTCIHHTRAGIEALLGEMRAAGIENILALRGDCAAGMTPETDFRHASDLVRFISEAGGFSVSGACYPECHPETPDKGEGIRHLKEKTDAGARHLISQLFFDNEDFRDLASRAREAGIDAPIEAGVMPIMSRAQIERMASLCGARLPEEVQAFLTRHADDKEALAEAGIAYAINQIKDLLASGADGIHLYTMNNPTVTRRILDGVTNS